MLWKKIDKEIRRCKDIHFWWRDDDVGDFIQPLERIINIFENKGLSIVLGVIPSVLVLEVSHIIKEHPNCYVIQHGVTHINHAQDKGRQDEFPLGFSEEEAVKQIVKGKKSLEQKFGEQFLPVYAPPWLNIHEGLSNQLLQNGFKEISSYNFQNENKHGNPDRELVNVNYGEAFYTEEYVLERLSYKLSVTNHIGFMNHHRTIGEDGFNFIKKLLDFLCQYSNVSWGLPL